MTKKKVLVAMSGGVDSALAALLLKEKNYEVLAFNFLQTESEFHLPKLRDFCEKFNIDLIVRDVRAEFKEVVVKSFVEEYQKGNTPSPCPNCNKEIKWAHLLRTADEYGIHYVATGHYAKIGRLGERYFITNPRDTYKSQTYFLWHLGQKELSRTVFPLGNLLKVEVKRKMKDYGLVSFAEQSESFGLCFMQQIKLGEFLKKHHIVEILGDIVFEGRLIGTHKGIQFYTIGQKISLVDDTYYVKEKDVEKQILYVGRKQELFKSQIIVTQLNSAKYSSVESFPDDVEIVINGKANPVKSKLVKLKDGYLQICLASPLYAPASGQEVAIYEENDLIGGGVIV